MKYLLVVLVVLFGIWLWRSRRVDDANDRAEARRAEVPPPPVTQDIVACPVCGLHLPASDAVTGQRGAYCSAEHRRRLEG